MTEKDIEKLNQRINSIANTLGNALYEIQELAVKIEKVQSKPIKKRRDLKQERITKYQYRFASGQIGKHRK